MPILYVESSTWCGFFLSWPCVPTPNVRSDIWDRVESYAIQMFLARRQKITFTSYLKLIISFLDHKYHSLLQLLILVASTRQAILTMLVSLRLAWRPSTQFANLRTRFVIQVRDSPSQDFFSYKLLNARRSRKFVPTSYLRGPSSYVSLTKRRARASRN
jgi:hypothetical protein